jgi:hypothetical protein
MTRTHHTTTTTSSRPGIMSRLRQRNQPAKVTTNRSTNPITGTQTVTKKTKTHPRGIGHHGHGGRGPMASHHTTNYTTSGTTSTSTAAPVHHHRRKTSVGDKVSGALMKLRGSFTRRPGVKVRVPFST